MDAFASRRPLYALFLAILFKWFGAPYLNAITAQILLTGIALLIAFALFRRHPARILALFYLSQLAIWEATTQSVFLTENLAILALIPGMTLIWLGVSAGGPSYWYLGLFFYGLSQAVRPWALLGLATVPWAAFFFSGAMRIRVRLSVLDKHTEIATKSKLSTDHVPGTVLQGDEDLERLRQSITLQDEFKAGSAIDITAGLRFDHYDDVGSDLSPRIAAVWRLTEHHIMKAQYARAFRPSTFSELYAKNSPVVIGNENLQSETIDTYERGYIYRLPKTLVRTQR
jgi:hypothetical protein